MRFLLPVLCLFFLSCQDNGLDSPILSDQENHANFHAAVKQHLNAIATRDLQRLKTTMHPEGTMYMIRPNTEVILGSEQYLYFHEQWFENKTWDLKAQITDSSVNGDSGVAIVDAFYKEPREGGPYWSKLNISFSLKRLDNQWYVISDHSSPLESSTDEKYTRSKK